MKEQDVRHLVLVRVGQKSSFWVTNNNQLKHIRKLYLLLLTKWVIFDQLYGLRPGFTHSLMKRNVIEHNWATIMIQI